MAERAFTAKVTAIHLRKAQIQINFGQQAMIADHPPSQGGDGLGPPPGHILLAALASSTAYFVARHAQLLNIPIESVVVTVDSDLKREEASGPLQAMLSFPKLYTRVEITGDLTDEQFQKLKFVAEHDVVGNTLRQGAEIDEQVKLIRPA